MRRGGAAGITANPVLIGAATTLIVIVAVFLAYNANAGLPFVPTYDLTVELPNTYGLGPGNDVAIAGDRVGSINEVTLRGNEDGTYTAEIAVKLETSVEELPSDTTVTPRARSVLGSYFLELTRGVSTKGLPNGGTLPETQAKPTPVAIDQAFNTFNQPTRQAIQANTAYFGDAFAYRGTDLNEAIANLSPTLENLIPVMQNLRAPSTRLSRWISELDELTTLLAPAAEQQAQLFVNLDATFIALAAVAPQIQETISETPPTLDQGIESFPRIRPFLVNTTEFVNEIRPGINAFRTAAPPLVDALQVGQRTLRRTPELTARLEDSFRTLLAFSRDPNVPLALEDGRALAASLNPTLTYLLPTQTVCNYVTLWFRNVSSVISVGDSRGTFQRFSILLTPTGENNEGGPASAPASGGAPALPPNPILNLQTNNLHVNPYPYTAAPGQPRVCEAGREAYRNGVTQTGNTGATGTETDVVEGKPGP